MRAASFLFYNPSLVGRPAPIWRLPCPVVSPTPAGENARHPSRAVGLDARAATRTRIRRESEVAGGALLLVLAPDNLAVLTEAGCEDVHHVDLVVGLEVEVPDHFAVKGERGAAQ